jgi:SAM-dependent methyltransferase
MNDPASGHGLTDAASGWVKRWAALIPEGGTVLDLACGSGRNSRYLAGLAYRVIATDIDTSVLAGLESVAMIKTLRADLEGDEWPFAGQSFDGIVVVNYLHRPLLTHLAQALGADGVLIYESFGQGNERYGRPSNPDYLLRPGELLEVFDPLLTVVAYEFGVEYEPRPAVRQRLCAVNNNVPVTLPTSPD